MLNQYGEAHYFLVWRALSSLSVSDRSHLLNRHHGPTTNRLSFIRLLFPQLLRFSEEKVGEFRACPEKSCSPQVGDYRMPSAKLRPTISPPGPVPFREEGDGHCLYSVYTPLQRNASVTAFSFHVAQCHRRPYDYCTLGYPYFVPQENEQLKSSAHKT